MYAGRKNAWALPNSAPITTICQIRTAPVSDQHRQRAVQRAADQVADDHHLLPGQPVRDHPADQQEQHQRQRVRHQHRADVARPPVSRVT